MPTIITEGVQGPEGAQGPSGATGPQGATGPAGSGGSGGSGNFHMAMMGWGDQYLTDHPEVTRTPGVSLAGTAAFSEGMIGGTVISFYSSEGYVEAFTVTGTDMAVYNPTFFDGWALPGDFDFKSEEFPLSSMLTIFLDYSGFSAGLYADNEPRQMSLWSARIMDGGDHDGGITLTSIARDRSDYIAQSVGGDPGEVQFNNDGTIDGTPLAYEPESGFTFDDPIRGFGFGSSPAFWGEVVRFKGVDPFNSPHYSLVNDGAGSFLTLNSWTLNGSTYEKTAGNADTLEFEWDSYEPNRPYHIYIEGQLSAGTLQVKSGGAPRNLQANVSDAFPDSLETFDPPSTGSFGIWAQVSWYPEAEDNLVEICPSEDFEGLITDIRVADLRRSPLVIEGSSGSKLEFGYQGDIITDLNVTGKALQIYGSGGYMYLDSLGLNIGFDRGNPGQVLVSKGDDDQMEWAGLDEVAFTPADGGDWGATPPGNLADAIDELADNVAALDFAPTTRTVGTGLGTSGTVDLDMASVHGTIQSITATGDITFTTSNRSAGREVTLVIAAGGSTRTLVWPSWIAVGAALPTALASGKTLVATVTFTDTTDAAAIAAAAVQP